MNKKIVHSIFEQLIFIPMIFLIAVEAGRAVDLPTTPPSLSVASEAKGPAMGGAFSAEAEGVDGLWYNPATLSKKKNSSLSLMHLLFLENMNYSTLGMAIPFGHKNALGVGLQVFSVGSVPSFDNVGTPASSYSPKDESFKLALSKTMFKTSVGVGATFLRSTIQTSASTVFLNAGLHQEIGPFQFGISQENIGGKLTYEKEVNKLPTKSRLGISLRLTPDCIINTDISKPKGDSLGVALGTEYTFHLASLMDINLRTGFNTVDAKDVSGLHGLSAGTGFVFGPAQISYAWVPFGDLGQTHRFSLDVDLPAKGNTESDDSEASPKSLIKRPEKTLEQKQKEKAKKVRPYPLYPWDDKQNRPHKDMEKMVELLAKEVLCAIPSPHAVVTRVQGDAIFVSASTLGKRIPIKRGQYFFEEDEIQTGANGIVQMIFANGTKVELGPNSIYRLNEKSDLCERPVSTLEKGDLYQETESNKEFVVKTSSGDFIFEKSSARINTEPSEIRVDLLTGTARYGASSGESPLKAGQRFVISGGKQSSAPFKLKDGNEKEFAAKIIAPASEKSTPGRWDQKYAQVFKSELRRLDSEKGLFVAEYIRDSHIREELKLKVLDMRVSLKDLFQQTKELKDDIQNFDELRNSLSQPPGGETSESRKERKARFADLKNSETVLKNAQQSLKEILKQLKEQLQDFRKSEEYLASIPIVRLLNITAEESTIPFESSRANIPESAYPVLDSISEAIKQLKPFRIVVEGHTDKSGPIRVNNKLSLQRAEAVSLYLQRKAGISRSLFKPKGMGSSKPVDETDSPEALQKNRRVEIWFELRGL